MLLFWKERFSFVQSKDGVHSSRFIPNCRSYTLLYCSRFVYLLLLRLPLLLLFCQVSQYYCCTTAVHVGLGYASYLIRIMYIIGAGYRMRCSIKTALQHTCRCCCCCCLSVCLCLPVSPCKRASMGGDISRDHLSPEVPVESWNKHAHHMIPTSTGTAVVYTAQHTAAIIVHCSSSDVQPASTGCTPCIYRYIVCSWCSSPTRPINTAVINQSMSTSAAPVYSAIALPSYHTLRELSSPSSLLLVVAPHRTPTATACAAWA